MLKVDNVPALPPRKSSSEPLDFRTLLHQNTYLSDAISFAAKLVACHGGTFELKNTSLDSHLAVTFGLTDTLRWSGRPGQLTTPRAEEMYLHTHKFRGEAQALVNVLETLLGGQYGKDSRVDSRIQNVLRRINEIGDSAAPVLHPKEDPSSRLLFSYAWAADSSIYRTLDGAFSRVVHQVLAGGGAIFVRSGLPQSQINIVIGDEMRTIAPSLVNPGDAKAIVDYQAYLSARTVGRGAELRPQEKIEESEPQRISRIFHRNALELSYLMALDNSAHEAAQKHFTALLAAV